jgi:hypothetical protein
MAEQEICDGLVRVFIGTEPKTLVAAKVLMHSVARRSARPFQFTLMEGPDWEVPDGLPKGTGFSLRRWLIPRHCDYRGRAIYLDADQIVLGDLAELWAKPDLDPGLPGTTAWLTYQPDKFSAEPWPQTSVMVIDCAAARDQWGWLPDRVYAHLGDPAHRDRRYYVDFMHAVWMQPQPRQIENGWNGLNHCNPGKTKLLHYTKEDAQPWYKPDHPFAKLWQDELRSALAAGAVTRADLTAALARWGQKEDWRKSNGLHPFYKPFAKLAVA